MRKTLTSSSVTFFTIASSVTGWSRPKRAGFFGESMFTLESYASRAAFAELCRVAWGWGFQFIDGQLPNPNLADLGARVVSREEFLGRLAGALEQPTREGLWLEGLSQNADK